MCCRSVQLYLNVNISHAFKVSVEADRQELQSLVIFKTQSCKDEETHHWHGWCVQFTRMCGRPGRTPRCPVAVRSDSCTRPSWWLLIGCVLFTQLQKGNTDTQKEYVQKNMLYSVCWVHIDMYLLTAVEKAGVVGEAQGLGLKNVEKNE